MTRFPAVTFDRLYIAGRANLRNFCVIRLAERVDYLRLQRAMRLSLDAEPILGCRFVERFFRPYWDRRSDLDRLQLSTLSSPRSRAEWEDALTHFMAARISATEDPLVHVLVLRESGDTLCFRLNHVMADGLATKSYVELVARLYRTLGVDARYSPEPNASTGRDLRQVVHRYRLAGRLRLAGKFLKRFVRRREPSEWCFPGAAVKRPSVPRLVSRTLPAERMEAVDRYCREHDVTTNEVLLAAMHLSLRKHVPSPAGSSPPIAIPVDLRCHLKDRRALAPANLVALMALRLPAIAPAGLDETVAMVREILFTQAMNTEGCLACVPVVLDLPPLRQLRAMIPFGMMSAVARRMGKRALGRVDGQVNRRGVALSNLGEIEPAGIRFDGAEVVDAFLTGAGSTAYGVLASRFNGALTLSYLIDESIVDPELFTRIVDTMVDYVPD